MQDHLAAFLAELLCIGYGNGVDESRIKGWLLDAFRVRRALYSGLQDIWRRGQEFHSLFTCSLLLYCTCFIKSIYYRE